MDEAQNAGGAGDEVARAKEMFAAASTPEERAGRLKNLILSLLQTGRVDEAMSYREDIVRLLPEMAVSLPEEVAPKGDPIKYEEAIEALDSAQSAFGRFCFLGNAAKHSIGLGKCEEAKKYAQELMSIASQFTGEWNYGNAVHDANMVLGLIAIREGRITDAGELLLEAGRSPGSPQLNSFGPNMRLALELLIQGQSGVVLEYLVLCGVFWKPGWDRLDMWSRIIKEGRIPHFGANLSY